MLYHAETSFVPAIAAGTPQAASLPAPAQSGLIAGTLVETDRGWRPVEALRPGDEVQTFDGGLQRVLTVQREVVTGAEGGLVLIPGGVLGATVPTELLPAQHVLLVHHAIEAAFDTPAVLVRAGQLVGLGGITRRPARARLRAIRPGLAEEEILWANDGLLLHAPRAHAATPDTESFFTRPGTAALGRALRAVEAALAGA
ncbi:Hint domain-containing protein [Rhodosalinus sp.]|uniref:Hint domain-containing protein n=1 Tax=Rhodosalinus sp. TaxID=2047741 RepID=UPI0039791E16